MAYHTDITREAPVIHSFGIKSCFSRSMPKRLALTLMTSALALGSTTIPATAQQISPIHMPGGLADLVERISPAVVNIKVTTQSGQTTTLGQGSGFIVTSSGEVVTNFHVIDGGHKIMVEFNTGIALPAKVIGTDAETDLALLKIQSDKTFPTVSFHQGAPIRIGDYVVAIGNPFGIGQSTSLGIISAIGRDTVDSGAYVDYIQTDATINTGNSGGPLFNPEGDVVGVNSAIYSPTGASVGIAFAIPHKTAEEVIQTIRKAGEVRRGWFGAGLRTAEFTQENREGVFKAGATVNNLVPRGPAVRQGLKVDDVILRINGQRVRNSVEATRLIGDLGPGQKAKVDIERNKTPMTLTITLAERPDKKEVEKVARSATGAAVAPIRPQRGQPRSTRPPTRGVPRGAYPTAPSGPSASAGDYGMSLVDLSSTFRDAVGMRPDQVGVYVESVSRNSAAAGKGVKSGMIILEAGNEPVASVRMFSTLYAKARAAGRSSLTLKLRTAQGRESYVSLPINGRGRRLSNFVEAIPKEE